MQVLVKWEINKKQTLPKSGGLSDGAPNAQVGACEGLTTGKFPEVFIT